MYIQHVLSTRLETTNLTRTRRDREEGDGKKSAHYVLAHACLERFIPKKTFWQSDTHRSSGNRTLTLGQY